tara:strand:+ start:252 stop:386 length:135 start_codon:yes stop_codon:yes gene_type:complete
MQAIMETTTKPIVLKILFATLMRLFISSMKKKMRKTANSNIAIR